MVQSSQTRSWAASGRSGDGSCVAIRAPRGTRSGSSRLFALLLVELARSEVAISTDVDGRSGPDARPGHGERASSLIAFGMIEAGDGDDPAGRRARGLATCSRALVALLPSTLAAGCHGSPAVSAAVCGRLGGSGERSGWGGEVIARSRSSHSAPTLVPLSAETASAGIFVPRIAFISGSGHGLMSVMLHTTNVVAASRRPADPSAAEA